MLKANTSTSVSAQSKILVVDDEAGIREGLKTSLEQMGYSVETAESGERALYRFRQTPGISFVLSDYKMPGMNGFDILKEIKKTSPQTPVVIMTGYGSIHHAVDAMQMGADDYLAKPFQVSDLEKIILKNTPSTIEEMPSVPAAFILSEDAEFKTLLRKAERAAASSAPILIEGPSGTGKELLARQIHDWSPRKSHSWVAINCAALPSGLLESELFGFEKGAFTGALDRKAGRFEQADGGTLLLDEIGELEPLLQAKLLRVLQEGEIDRLGGKKPIKVNVRVIATTNKNLERLVAEGKFREDLFFRLYGVRFTLSALKDRKEDIRLLANEFLKRQSAVQGRNLHFSNEVIPALKEMAWPGNIRELERSVERACVLSETDEVALEHFEFTPTQNFKTEIQFQNFSLKSFENETNAIDSTASSKSIREMEKEIILRALEAHNGNRTHTAKSLGMSLRTLRHKLKVYREADASSASSAGQNTLGKKWTSTSYDTGLIGPSGASTPGQILASSREAR
ncbi:MAG: sigma-54-dependent Fis family transcriptional regulator [Deltaproteobacteria bacterium]|nr:sigma-54-dependent Fis family transcriptional regulator [Deltaproteobacteria bacterium]